MLIMKKYLKHGNTSPKGLFPSGLRSPSNLMKRMIMTNMSAKPAKNPNAKRVERLIFFFSEYLRRLSRQTLGLKLIQDFTYLGKN